MPDFAGEMTDAERKAYKRAVRGERLESVAAAARAYVQALGAGGWDGGAGKQYFALLDALEALDEGDKEEA